MKRFFKGTRYVLEGIGFGMALPFILIFFGLWWIEIEVVHIWNMACIKVRFRLIGKIQRFLDYLQAR